MTNEEATKKANDLVTELLDEGFSLEPVFRSTRNALFAEIQIRPLTDEEKAARKPVVKEATTTDTPTKDANEV